MSGVKTLPSRIYKYEALTAQTLRNVKGQVLYFGSPRGFNDPYDCALTPHVKALSDAEVESIRRYYLTQVPLSPGQRSEFEAASVEGLRMMFFHSAHSVIKDARDEFLNKRGVTCFSEVNDDLLMWSHYGGRYKGVCLEFDTQVEPFDRIKPVSYLPKLPEIDVASLLLEADDLNQVFELFCTKSKSWAYEREWRALHQVAGTNYIYRADALTGVFFGPDIDDQSLEIVCLVLAGQNETVKFYRGFRSETEFKVNFAEFTYTSFLDAKRKGLRK